jgi:UDP-N-acetylmuramate dehydrogenase
MAMDMREPFLIEHPLRGQLRHDEPMAKHVSWRAGGRARLFFQPADLADLQAFLAALPAAVPVLFVGLGSNLLVRDAGFAGAVVLTHRALTGIEEAGDRSDFAARQENGARRRFQAAAGVPAPHLARFVGRHGAGGAEWLAGIPGTVGGALAMNAGCYGGETWKHVLEVQTVDRGGVLARRTPQDFDLGYRHVELKSRAPEWFVSGLFAFAPGDPAQAHAAVRELLAKRVASQPLNLPNAGSVFRNPPGDHAARLIEACGLKGFTIGGAQVSPKHANFIVNAGRASAADIESVVDHVQARVRSEMGIELVREVRIVGDAP